MASGRSVEAMNTTDFDMLITHPDRDVRLRAAMDAGALRDAGVTDILVSRIAVEEDFHVRENLTWALVQHGEDATPAVLAWPTLLCRTWRPPVVSRWRPWRVGC